MIEILKVVEKCKIYQNEGSQGSLGAGHLTRKFAQMARIRQNLKIYARVARDGNAWNCQIQFSFQTLNFTRIHENNAFCITRSLVQY